MEIFVKNNSQEEEVEDDKELKHQKSDANPDKFQRKTKLKRDVEDIFDLNGSTQKRKEYMDQNIKNHLDKGKKKSWAEIFGIVKNDPNS